MTEFSYVYVLVSSKADSYYEQTLVSAMSLRKHMPDANILLLVDDETESTMVGCRAEIKKIVSKVIPVHNLNLNNLQKSRFIKTNIPNYVQGDFLYIDSDTIITSSLEEIETCDMDVGAVLDRHLALSHSPVQSMIEKNAEKIGYNASVRDEHFNGGVMLFHRNEKSLDFFKKWHDLWLESAKKGLSIDQLALAQANYLCGGLVCELPGIWNCQVEAGAKFLSSAKILHFFTSALSENSPHPLMKKSFYDEIKKNGLTGDIMEVINNPLQHFVNKTQIIGNQSVDFYNTAFVKACFRFYRNRRFKFFFDIVDKLLDKFIRINARKKAAYSKLGAK